MASRRGALLLIKLDQRRDSPLYRQIYDELRQRILDGRLTRGAKLPSTRALSTDLRVSRSTVVQAFDQLRAEGYIDSLRRGATRVSARLPEALTHARREPHIPTRTRSEKRVVARRPVSPEPVSLMAVIADRPARAFRTSVPALDMFPMDTWGRLMMRRWRRLAPAALSYGDPRGLAELRGAIAAYLTSARNVRCTPEQIVVTAGSQQGLDLIARVLLRPNDQVWMEDPGYPYARAAFAAAGARVVPVPIDGDGLDVAAGIKRAPGAALAFVTPARQVPLGVMMTLNRRLALLDWANEQGAWILEDDFDSEFRYSTRPLASLQGLDQSDRVIMLGTFSKVMFPALRLGYVVLPPALVEPVAQVRQQMDLCAPYLSQAVMADFISGGHFERHIRRMRELYRSRRALLVRLLARDCAGLLVAEAPDAGLNLIAWLAPGLSDRRAAAALDHAGIDALPLSLFAMKERLRPGLLLGFSGLRESDLRDGVKRLRRVLEPIVRASKTA